MSKHAILSTAIWIVAMIVALSLDYRISHWVHTSGFGKQVEAKAWAQVIKAPGEFSFTIGVVALLFLFRQIRFKQAVFVLLCGVVSGTNFILKWIVGRHRPYKIPGTLELHPFDLRPFAHGLVGLFNQHDLCFPSGHACTACALATAIYFVWPRGLWIFVLLAICVGIERPAENAHYASDVIGAVGFAVVSTALLHRALSDWLRPVPLKGEA